MAMIFTHKLCTAICIDIETFHITKPREVKLCLLSKDFAYFELNVDVTFYPSEDSVVYWKCKKCKHEGDHVHSKDAGCKLFKKPLAAIAGPAPAADALPLEVESPPGSELSPPELLPLPKLRTTTIEMSRLVTMFH